MPSPPVGIPDEKNINPAVAERDSRAPRGEGLVGGEMGGQKTPRRRRWGRRLPLDRATATVNPRRTADARAPHSLIRFPAERTVAAAAAARPRPSRCRRRRRRVCFRHFSRARPVPDNKLR